jgi:hypothetical protein
MPPLAVIPWVTVREPVLVVVTPVLPIVMAEALAAPRLMVPLVPVLVPTSILTFPEAPPPAVTLPEAIVMLDELPLPTLVVVRLVAPAPWRDKVPEVVVRLELVLP